MLVGTPQVDEFGFSITSPFKAVARGVATGARTVGHGAATGVRYTGKGVKVVAKTAYKGVEWTVIKPTMWLVEKAMAPVKHRVQKLVHRRASKLAWDRRKSKTPTPAEVSEARAWTKSKLRGEPPHGTVLSVFAGAGPMPDELGDSYQLGVAPALVAAAVPVLVAAAQQLLSKFSSSGEAPANPGADAAAAAAAPDSPAAPGEMDMTPVQDAADQAKDAIDQASAAATGKKLVKLPGGMHVSQKSLMIGGAVIGGLILLMALQKK